MATYDEELMCVARQLSTRHPGERGRLSRARIRRSVSTSYYAVFHFLLDEVSAKLVGSHPGLGRRRRIFARVLSHTAIRTTLDKVSGRIVDQGVAEFLRPAGRADGPLSIPVFVKLMAQTFADAQSQRHHADYDLNKPLSELDAQLLVTRVARAIGAWRAANAPADRDFKQALCVLISLKGQLRRET